jgi:MFS superfamily sulfate permease-like transporter
MDRLILILLGIVVVFAGVTFLLSRLAPRIRSIKYVPALLSLIGSGYFYYLLKTVHLEGFADLGNALMAAMFFIGFCSGLATAVTLDLMRSRK